MNITSTSFTESCYYHPAIRGFSVMEAVGYAALTDLAIAAIGATAAVTGIIGCKVAKIAYSVAAIPRLVWQAFREEEVEDKDDFTAYLEAENKKKEDRKYQIARLIDQEFINNIEGSRHLWQVAQPVLEEHNLSDIAIRNGYTDPSRIVSQYTSSSSSYVYFHYRDDGVEIFIEPGLFELSPEAAEFALLHELGHVVNKDYTRARNNKAQIEREWKADAFAIEHASDSVLKERVKYLYAIQERNMQGTELYDKEQKLIREQLFGADRVQQEEQIKYPYVYQKISDLEGTCLKLMLQSLGTTIIGKLYVNFAMKVAAKTCPVECKSREIKHQFNAEGATHPPSIQRAEVIREELIRRNVEFDFEQLCYEGRELGRQLFNKKVEYLERHRQLRTLFAKEKSEKYVPSRF